MSWKTDIHQIHQLNPHHILFLCVANSARSQMAEGIARQLADKSIVISSAGSNPKTVHPQAIIVLNEIGINISHHISKSVSDIDSKDVDVVITLCAEEVCPMYLGTALKFHWPLVDPAAEPGDKQLNSFRQTRDELFTRLSILFTKDKS